MAIFFHETHSESCFAGIRCITIKLLRKMIREDKTERAIGEESVALRVVEVGR